MVHLSGLKHQPTVKQVLTVVTCYPLYMGGVDSSEHLRTAVSTPTNSETGDTGRASYPLYIGGVSRKEHILAHLADPRLTTLTLTLRPSTRFTVGLVPRLLPPTRFTGGLGFVLFYAQNGPFPGGF